jgi:hypothetical protein
VAGDGAPISFTPHHTGAPLRISAGAANCLYPVMLMRLRARCVAAIVGDRQELNERAMTMGSRHSAYSRDRSPSEPRDSVDRDKRTTVLLGFRGPHPGIRARA